MPEDDEEWDDPPPPPVDGEVFAELRLDERRAAPPPNLDPAALAARRRKCASNLLILAQFGVDFDRLLAVAERRADRERRQIQAVSAGDWESLPGLAEEIVAESLPGEISAHFADREEFGSGEFTRNLPLRFVGRFQFLRIFMQMNCCDTRTSRF